MLFSKLSISAFVMSVTLSCLGVASAQPAKVQKGASKGSQVSPTKEETAEFLSTKIGMRHAEPDISGKSYWETRSKFSNDSCTITLETDKYVNEVLVSRVVAEGDLSKIDPKRVRSFSVAENTLTRFLYGSANPSHIVQLITTAEEKILTSTKFVFENGEQISEKSTLVDVQWVFTANADSAQRVEKAMKHLIAICGGKSELF